MVIGLTGGVGSGKSTVAKLLNDKYNAELLLADDIAKKLMEKGEVAYKNVVKEFGNEILDHAGNIDSKNLAGIVFANTEKLALLNSITHPAVINYIKEEITLLQKDNKKIIVVESAMLVETGCSKLCDYTVTVVTDTNLRIKRLENDRGYTKDKTESVMNNQKSNDWLVEHTDFVIVNDSDIYNLEKKVDELIEKLEEAYVKFER